MLTVGREAIVLRGLSTWGSRVSMDGVRRFHKRELLYSCDRNPPRPRAGRPRACVAIAFGVLSVFSKTSRCYTLRFSSHFVVSQDMDMNADPFEHAKLVVTLIESFYGNLLDLVGGPATVMSHDNCACLDTPLFPSNRHGHYTIYNTYLKQFR
jgi:hypothetical protein